MPIYNLAYGIKESSHTTYTISNIPTSYSQNTYVNVAHSGEVVDSVKFTFSINSGVSNESGIYISLNQSNDWRYGIRFVASDGRIYVQGGLVDKSIEYRRWSRSSTSGNCSFEIKRNGNCIFTYGEDSYTYTAVDDELIVIQAIMDVSDMNVYASQSGSWFADNEIGVDVTYTTPTAGGTKYYIAGIPTSNTNVYVNVAQSGKTIDEAIFTFKCLKPNNNNSYISISSNNSNTSRYGLVLQSDGTIRVRGRTSGSDNYYRDFTNAMTSTEMLELTVNRDGNCSLDYGGDVNTWTATGAELTVIQTIMNLSNMNVYAAQWGEWFGSNLVEVEVTYS